MALVAALTFWNYVGGPTHLDYVPWEWKGILSLGVAVCAVKITAAGSRAIALRWLAFVTVLVIACGLLSYYAHINEPQDQGDEEDQVVPTCMANCPLNSRAAGAQVVPAACHRSGAKRLAVDRLAVAGKSQVRHVQSRRRCPRPPKFE